MQKYICKTCNAELFWNPSAGALLCQYCGSTFQPSDFVDNTLNVIQKNEELDTRYTSNQPTPDSSMVVYACTHCGAEIVTSKNTMATTCAYCGHAISITSKSAGRFRPEIVIPYAISKEQAQDLYKKYVSKSFLTPSSFKNKNKIEKMQGLYVPFWLHSMTCCAEATYECENVSHRRRGDDRITTHKVYNVYVEADGTYERIPTDGSKKLDNTLMDALEPFDYRKLATYNPAYMAGFYSEQPDEEKIETLPRAQTRVVQSMKENMEKTAGHYSSKKLRQFSNNFHSQNVEYAMLPVWLLNVNYKDSTYTFAVNGDTAKVVGKLPINIPKLIACVVASGVATQLIALLIRFITHLL